MPASSRRWRAGTGTRGATRCARAERRPRRRQAALLVAGARRSTPGRSGCRAAPRGRPRTRWRSCSGRPATGSARCSRSPRSSPGAMPAARTWPRPGNSRCRASASRCCSGCWAPRAAPTRPGWIPGCSRPRNGCRAGSATAAHGCRCPASARGATTTRAGAPWPRRSRSTRRSCRPTWASCRARSIAPSACSSPSCASMRTPAAS